MTVYRPLIALHADHTPRTARVPMFCALSVGAMGLCVEESAANSAVLIASEVDHARAFSVAYGLDKVEWAARCGLSRAHIATLADAGLEALSRAVSAQEDAR